MKRDGMSFPDIGKQLDLGVLTVTGIYRNYVGEVGPNGSTRLPARYKRRTKVEADPGPEPATALCGKCGKPWGTFGNHMLEYEGGQPSHWTCDYEPPPQG